MPLEYECSGTASVDAGWQPFALRHIHLFEAGAHRAPRCTCDGENHTILRVVNVAKEHNEHTILFAAANAALDCTTSGFVVAWAKNISRKRLQPGDGQSLVVALVYYNNGI